MQVLGGAALVVLVAAVAIFAHALTSSGPSSITSSAKVFAGKGHTGFVPGKPIDGISCGAMEGTFEHIHAHLDLVVDGVRETPPAYVGILAQSKQAGCLYWIHTHPDYAGVIHIEAPVSLHATLGDFLDIWAATPQVEYWKKTDESALHTILTRQPTVAVVNGKPYSGDIRAIPLEAHELITIGYGTHTVTQPGFDFSLVG